MTHRKGKKQADLTTDHRQPAIDSAFNCGFMICPKKDKDMDRKGLFTFFLLIITVFVFSCEKQPEQAADRTEARHLKQVTFPLSPDDKYCHRCGMRATGILKDKIHFIRTVKGEIWYACCPMCLLMDISESTGGLVEAKAYSNASGREIILKLRGSQIIEYEPQTTLIMMGGSCLKNKIFYNENEKHQFLETNHWAADKPVRNLIDVYKKIHKKSFERDRCAMCAAKLNPQLEYVIMSAQKKRLVACCAHCGLFLEHKLGSDVKRAIARDYVNGKYYNAHQMYYVVDNDLVLCCIPSTIAFLKESEAGEFQKKHKGTTMTFAEVMGNIRLLMSK